MNTRTRMQLLAAFAATTVLFAAGCDQRNATDKSAASTSSSKPGSSAMTSTTPATSSSKSSDTSSASTSAPGSSSMASSSGTGSTSGSSSAMGSADDATITTKVKAAVMAEPNLKSTQIDVDTKDGVVTLAGTVSSQEAKQRANQVAQQVQGVKSVSDQLVVKAS